MKLQYKHNPPTAPWGRFGGGWQIKAGFQLARGTLIIDLFVASLRFDFYR